uniref:Pectinesterase inhibitor domain-containing protein n=1 Tax=Fagus sylvatica TaxID=28930 RepID=A0A2N9ISS3_FAGSY
MKEMMASLLLSLMLAILLVCPTNARLSMKVTEDVLKEICSPHEDPPFCLQALKSDPRTPFVDLVGLTNISIHLADVYDLCYQLYDSNVAAIESAKNAWKAGNYLIIIDMAEGCLTDCSDCEDAISIAASSPLAPKNKEVSRYCETMLLVSRRTSGD